MAISRREFLGTTAIGGVVADSLIGAEPKMPTRILGKTGIEVSILAFGGGSRFYGFKNKAGQDLGYKDEEQAVAIVKRAFDLGINYIDTADEYEVSEERYGMALKAHGRKGITVATKISARDGDGF
jgi:aryl-alcohol dehydrogenase-like predicted oxidoreductase